jgi:hypothetical protein
VWKWRWYIKSGSISNNGRVVVVAVDVAGRFAFSGLASHKRFQTYRTILTCESLRDRELVSVNDVNLDSERCQQVSPCW